MTQPQIDFMKVEVAKLSLAPSDVLVVRINSDCPDPDQFRYVRDGFKKVMEKAGLKNEVLITSGELELTVVSKKGDQ